MQTSVYPILQIHVAVEHSLCVCLITLYRICTAWRTNRWQYSFHDLTRVWCYSVVVVAVVISKVVHRRSTRWNKVFLLAIKSTILCSSFRFFATEPSRASSAVYVCLGGAECVSNVDEQLAEVFLMDEEPTVDQLKVSSCLIFTFYIRL